MCREVGSSVHAIEIVSFFGFGDSVLPRSCMCIEFEVEANVGLGEPSDEKLRDTGCWIA